MKQQGGCRKTAGGKLFFSGQPHICIVNGRVSGAGKNDSLWPQLHSYLSAMQA